MTSKDKFNWLEIKGNKVYAKDLLFFNNSFDVNSTEFSVIDFAQKWLSDQTVFEQQSSGSTGIPKKIFISRDKMLASAKATLQTLELKAGDTALLSISPNYIGGKMMIVRALVQGMNLIIGEVKGNPFTDLKYQRQIDFYSFVPYQLSKTLDESPENAEKLNAAKAVILGGAPVTQSLEKKVRQMVNAPVFSTYGMTETVSHVALKRLNGVKKAPFKALKDIWFSQDESGCLIIHAPHITGQESLTTNDVVKLYSDTAFNWLGRKDFVINSGGIKIHPEQLEKEIESVFNNYGTIKDFFIFEKPHEQLGSCLCLAVEGTADTAQLLKDLKKVLPAFYMPKEIHIMPAFVYTESGKVNKLETIKKQR